MVVRADGNQHRRKFQRDLLATQPDFSVRGRHPSRELFTVTDLSSVERRSVGKGTHLEESPGFFDTNEFNLIAENDFDRLNNKTAHTFFVRRGKFDRFLFIRVLPFFFSLWKEILFGKVEERLKFLSLQNLYSSRNTKTSISYEVSLVKYIFHDYLFS